MAVARVTQVIGASPHSWEDAVRNALERANTTLRGITRKEELKENAPGEKGPRNLARRELAGDVGQMRGRRDEQGQARRRLDGIAGLTGEVVGGLVDQLSKLGQRHGPARR